jgi:RNA polymerase sigma-70 factor (ECF subfamily)
VTEEEAGSDAELALQAQAGERRAFNKLVQRHKDSLFRFVRRYIGDGDDAYDIVQDTFISAWLALPRYDRSKSFPSWLRAIALNKCRDFGRRQTVRRRFSRMIGFYEPEPPAEQEQAFGDSNLENQRLARLDKAVAELAPFYKEPLLLTTVSGLSQQDAAIQLNTTTKAIEMRIRRAKKKLAEALADLKGGE